MATIYKASALWIILTVLFHFVAELLYHNWKDVNTLPSRSSWGPLLTITHPQQKTGFISSIWILLSEESYLNILYGSVYCSIGQNAIMMHSIDEPLFCNGLARGKWLRQVLDQHAHGETIITRESWHGAKDGKRLIGSWYISHLHYFMKYADFVRLKAYPSSYCPNLQEFWVHKLNEYGPNFSNLNRMCNVNCKGFSFCFQRYQICLAGLGLGENQQLTPVHQPVEDIGHSINVSFTLGTCHNLRLPIILCAREVW